MYQIALISGSLRKSSTNSGILRSVVQVNKIQKRFEFIWIDIHNFPIFNEDTQSKGIPAPVQTARDILKKCDAILFAVPQYNFSIAAPLKNAYDWLARDDKQKYCPMNEAIVGMVSSGGFEGGVKAQAHFRESVGYRKVKLLKPSVDAQILIQISKGKYFDQSGNLIDAGYKKRIGVFLKEFYQFIRQNKKK